MSLGRKFKAMTRLRKKPVLNFSTWRLSFIFKWLHFRVGRKMRSLQLPLPPSVRDWSPEVMISNEWMVRKLGPEMYFWSHRVCEDHPHSSLVLRLWSLSKCKFSWEKTLYLMWVTVVTTLSDWGMKIGHRKERALPTSLNLVALNDYSRTFIRIQIQSWPQHWSKLTTDG